MFKYCPHCASQNIGFERNRVFRCPDCGFVYYHNIAAATGLVISTDRGILLIERAKEPARGKFALPGGFVDPGEGAVDGLRRECREEIGWDPGPSVNLYASFPNIYPYKGIVYNTCDLFFTISAQSLCGQDLSVDPKEISGICFIRAEEVSMDDLAFDSTRRAIKAFQEAIKQPRNR
ncbi:MAG: NUDIX domain-containing protein [Treponema sp.]|jgi:ADP-ribose pyrophosphatase YjhB (NUDIX family)|nr:NUDIX domain-containing protein [Treponema sp.]